MTGFERYCLRGDRPEIIPHKTYYHTIWQAYEHILWADNLEQTEV